MFQFFVFSCGIRNWVSILTLLKPPDSIMLLGISEEMLDENPCGWQNLFDGYFLLVLAVVCPFSND